MKRKHHFMQHIGKVILLLFLVALCHNPLMARAAAKTVNVKSTVISTSSVKLTWSKKSGVKKYKLIAYSVDKKHKKTVTIKGSSKYYTFKKLKSGKEYNFYLYGYNRKGKKIYSGLTVNYMGFRSPMILSDREEDGAECHEYPDRITLAISAAEMGIHATAIQIYRKEASGSYKLLATVKASAHSYVDKKVSFGKKYSYKLRSYYTKKGKKYYSRYTNEFSMTAINEYGIYTMYTLTKLGVPTKEVVVQISSNSKNGTMRFYPDTFDVRPGDKKDLNCYPADISDSDIPEFEMMNISQISSDGVNWTDCPSVIELLPGNSIYLKYNLPVERTLTTSGYISCEMGTLNYIGGRSSTACLYFSNDAKGYTDKFDEYRE